MEPIEFCLSPLFTKKYTAKDKFQLNTIPVSNSWHRIETISIHVNYWCLQVRCLKPRKLFWNIQNGSKKAQSSKSNIVVQSTGENTSTKENGTRFLITIRRKNYSSLEYRRWQEQEFLYKTNPSNQHQNTSNFNNYQGCCRRIPNQSLGKGS